MFLPKLSLKNELGFPVQLPLSLVYMNLNSLCRHPVTALLLVINFVAPLISARAVAVETNTVQPGAAAIPLASVGTNADVVANSVVKVFSTACYPDSYKPWADDKTATAIATSHGQRSKIVTCRLNWTVSIFSNGITT